jgi:hypothetical protein
MKKMSWLWLLVLLTAITSTNAQVNDIPSPKEVVSGDFLRLRLDLDGDGRADVFTFALSKAKEDWRGILTVKATGARYSTEYFSADGDIPSVRVVRLDAARTERQLLVQTVEAGSCVFHLLAYKAKRLVPLVRFDAGPDCAAPQIWGNGKLGLSTWQGFWNRTEVYRLGANGLSISKEPQEHYPVGVRGIAGVNLRLDDAGCLSAEIASGKLLRVEIFDAGRKGYLLKTSTGDCGWIPETEVDTIDEKIKDLPWAG